MSDKSEFIFSSAEPQQFSVKNADSHIRLSDWKNYEIDFSKVSTLEDVVNILRGMRIVVSMDASAPNPDFAPLIPYLKPYGVPPQLPPKGGT